MVQFECPRHWKPSVSFTFGVGWTPFSHYWPSGVIRIGLPVWRWKRWNNFGMWEVQRAAKGPVWMPQALKPLCLIQFWSWKNSLFPLLALWGNKNWPPQYEGEKDGIIWECERCKGLQMVQFECPRHPNPSVSSNFEVGWIPFSHYWPSGEIRIGLPVWKRKLWKSSGTKRAQ